MPVDRKNIFKIFPFGFFIVLSLAVSIFLGSCSASASKDKEAIQTLFQEARKAADIRDYNRAKNIYSRILKKDPQNAYAYFSLGYIAEISGELINARKFYEQAASFSFEDPELYYNLGNVYVKLQDGEKAQKAYLKAVELNPQHLNAYINLSIVSFQLGDYQSAVKYCDEAVVLGYDAPLEYLNTLQQFRR